MSNATPSRWKALRYRLEWLACAGLEHAVRLLPRRACVLLAQTLGWAAYHLDRRGRTVALANLALVFHQKTENERRTIALRSYQSFARTMVDLFWTRRLTPENWRNHIEIIGAPPPPTGRQGYIYLCIHWGHFEWASIATGYLGIPCQIVAESFKNPHLSAIFNTARQHSGHEIIPQEGSMIRLLKRVKRGGGTGMLADLTLRPEQAATCIQVFERWICTTFLHGVLVQRGGAKLIPVHGEALPDGRCRITYDPPLDLPENADPTQIAQHCWDHYAPTVQARPELWMWAYKHWRYRPQEAAPATYPPYANPSRKFEKLLSRLGKSPKK